MPFKIIESRYSVRDLSELARKEIRNGLRLAILDVTREVSSSMRKDLEKTVEHWNPDTKVKFASSRRGSSRGVNLGSGGDKIEHLIYATGGSTDIWNLLDLGGPTKGRGDKEWRAKTTPGTFESSEGAGWWNPNINQMNLIAARGWTRLLEDTYEERYRDKLQDAVFAKIDELEAKLNKGRG